MQVANVNGIRSFTIEDFYDEYLELVRDCLLNQDKMTVFMCHVVDDLTVRNGLLDRRYDIGCQFLSLWKGGWDYSESDISTMNMHGIHKFLTVREYIDLAKVGMREFENTNFFITDFEEYVKSSLKSHFGNDFDVSYLDHTAFCKDVVFPDLKNVARLGLLQEIMEKSPGSSIQLNDGVIMAV